MLIHTFKCETHLSLLAGNGHIKKCKDYNFRGFLYFRFKISLVMAFSFSHVNNFHFFSFSICFHGSEHKRRLQFTSGINREIHTYQAFGQVKFYRSVLFCLIISFWVLYKIIFSVLYKQQIPRYHVC